MTTEVEYPTTTATVPALGVSYVIGLGEAQITFQTHLPVDLDPAEANAIIDKMAALGGRQKAIAELPALRDELLKYEDMLANLTEDLGRADQKFLADQADRDGAIVALQEEEARAHEAAETKLRDSGRSADYNGSPAWKQVSDRYNRDVAKVIAVKRQAEADRGQHLEEINVSMKRHSDIVERLKASIAERENKVG